MSIASINGMDVFFLTAGDPKKPAIIFSNSLGTDHSLWDGQLELLKNDFYVIRYDTRGHGFSSAPAGPYTIEQLSKDVLGLLDYLKIDTVSFCGISMGGLIGQWLAVNAPDRLNALIIANTSSKIGTCKAWTERAAQVRKEGLNFIAESAPSRWFTSEFYAAHPESVHELTGKLNNMNPEGYASCCEALAVADLRSRLSEIQASTLIICGAMDPVTTVHDAQCMQSQIKNSTLQLIPASHISNIEAELEFNFAIRNFLGDLFAHNYSGCLLA